jgi:eukaryotic-like serine/threonine-protein kinase
MPGSLGRLGAYEVTAVLGRGGFGVVLKALDPSLGRVVAIKVLAPQLATSAAARGRFAREARAAAAVVHDHVVAIHAVDSWNGLPYLVMPFVAGRSLQERVDRDGPMDVKEVLRIGVQTAQGLAAAHAQGLVHRDVKPSNILLENGVERVKLTDFGLARAVDDASLTESGIVAGTPQYMSPEQARGEPVDHRSDLFSLGSVLYFMCTGHSPFRATSTPAVLRRVSDEPPRPLRDVNLDVPEWLAAIVNRLQEKDPAHRFQSAIDVAETMGRYLSNLQRGLPITAPRTAPDLSSDPRQRRRTLIAAAVLIPALALAVATCIKPNLVLPLLAVSRPAAAEASSGPPGIGQEHVFTIIMDSESKDTIVGSGTLAAKAWDVTGFDRVEVRSTFRAEITKGTTFNVTTTAEDNVLPHLQVVKDGTTLKIGLDRGSYRLKLPLKVEITLPALVGLEIDGASKGTLKGFGSEREFKAKISGSSELAGSLAVERCDFKVDGASTLALDGSAQAAQLSAEGSSHLKLRGFLLKQGQIELEGASTAEITVQSDVLFKAEVSGSSMLNGSIQAKNLDLNIDDASHVTLTGAASDAKIHADSASSVTMPRLVLQNAAVKLSGASHATVDARGKLTYELSSASTLKYMGDPATLEGTKSGASSISRSGTK